jgi:fatty-acyl-CoA synthase
MPVAPVLLTSGTTGVPKGARRSARAVDPAAALALLETIPYQSGDVTVIPTPLFHAWGLTQLSIAIGTASTSVLVRRFDPAATLSAVQEHRATVLALVPVMMRRILSSEVLATTATGSLRVVASSGSALAADAALEWMDRVGDTLYNLYGSTEVGQATIATPDDLRAAPGTAGRVVPGISVEVVDAHGDAVPTGEQGRIMVGGRGQFSGYTGGGTKEMLRGLMATGDVGYFDRDARLFVTGRADDMIVSGGENVYPQEVEDLLHTIDGIVDCAVAGVPDEEFGQRLKAWVVSASDATLDPDEIRSLVARRLARHKVPRDIAFVDTLPRTSTGKLRRVALSDQQ